MRFLRTALLFSMGTLVAVGQNPKVAVFTSGSYLGVALQEIDGERAKALKLPEEVGVEITRVESDSPADKAGLKTGDVIMQYNGQRIEGFEQFSRLVRETPAGREVKLSIFRGGAAQTIPVKIGTHRPPQVVLPAKDFPFSIQIPDLPRSFMSWRSSALGVDAESLEGQLAEYFGVKEGVLVRSVVKGSAADKAGIKAGDVITRVGDSKTATPADISGRIRSTRGNPIPVVVMRDHKEVTLNVTIADDDRGERLREQFENLRVVKPGFRTRTINSIVPLQ